MDLGHAAIAGGMGMQRRPHALGLKAEEGPLVNISYTTNWDSHQNDDLIKETMRATIDKMEVMAEKSNTHHRYKYANYCAAWQNPYDGYGGENTQFLQLMSKKYDPGGLFQSGCAGGCKLNITSNQ